MEIDNLNCAIYQDILEDVVNVDFRSVLLHVTSQLFDPNKYNYELKIKRNNFIAVHKMVYFIQFNKYYISRNAWFLNDVCLTHVFNSHIIEMGRNI